MRSLRSKLASDLVTCHPQDQRINLLTLKLSGQQEKNSTLILNNAQRLMQVEPNPLPLSVNNADTVLPSVSHAMRCVLVLLSPDVAM